MNKATQQEKNGLYELTSEAEEELKESDYYNADLAPTKIEERTWNAFSICNLWGGMSISIPALALSATLVFLGVSPMLAVLNVILGNLIVLIPIQLNSHIGTKYGIPFPIFSRMTFGNKGAHLPTFSRSIIACGWTAVQSWVGGGAVAALIGISIPMMTDPSITISLPGNDSVVVGQVIGYFIFIIIVFLVAYNGMGTIKWVQNIGGPILMVLMTALLAWSMGEISNSGHSLGYVFAYGNDSALLEQNGGFAFVYMAGLTGNIAYWSTMALNMPDFSRFAKSQKSQFVGQLIGMPIPMALCAFVGAIFAQATKYTMGEAMFDPTGVFYHVENDMLITVCAIGVIMATITTCVAANVVAPANGFSNMAPKKITYKKGVIITYLVATFVTQPWWIYGTGISYVFTWLNNLGTIIAPVAAILIADYFVCKQKLVDVAGLYKGEKGRYWYNNGWNTDALIAWGASFIIPLVGNTILKYQAGSDMAPNFIQIMAANGYLISFTIAFFVYILLMKEAVDMKQHGYVSEQEYKEFTVDG